MGIAIYMLAFSFLLTGLYALVAKKNVVRIIIGIAILDYGINLLLVLMGYRTGGGPPILAKGQTPAQLLARSVDPIPQVLVLTNIVVELAMVVMMVALAIRLYDRYGTFDMNDIRRLRG
jgi:multicomponent Na+:H+ antiporter subunit C